MFSDLLNVFYRLQPAHVARTPEERQAVYRMRYHIYVAEQKRAGLPLVEGEIPEVHTPEDDEPLTMVFYLGKLPDIDGTVRIRVFPPGKLPPALLTQYTLERFPDIQTRTTCQVGFLMVKPSFRGTASVIALTGGAVDQVVRQHGVEMMIADCMPAHFHAYRRLGLRPFGGRIFSSNVGVVIPLVGITADLSHARAVRSPWYPVLKRLERDGQLPTRDFAALVAPTRNGGVETDPGRIEAAVEKGVAELGASFLGRLPARTRRSLVRNGMILDIEAGVDVIRQGFASRDIFVVIEGHMDVIIDGANRKSVGPGEIVGEIAFFDSTGLRSASLKSTTACRLLHLRRSVIRRFAKGHPADGLLIYEALGEVLARRLAAANPGNGSNHAGDPRG